MSARDLTSQPSRASRRLRRLIGPLLGAASVGITLPACELREVTLAQPEDVLVVEVVLRTGDTLQTALLQRTGGDAAASALPSALIEVRAPGGEVMRYRTAPRSRCFQGPGGAAQPPSTQVSCYVASGSDVLAIREGHRYTLRVQVADGRELHGATVVPGEFQLRSPPDPVYGVAPNTRLTLAWTPADDAWAYLAEARFEGLREALEPLGTEVPEDPLTLLGLAIGSTDTTMALPGGFGLFDRLDADLLPTLIALQQGIPDRVAVDVRIAAVDRNYVNWRRGGNFNPSGQVQVPSVFGDGTGVFGSLVLRGARIEAGAPVEGPAVLPE